MPRNSHDNSLGRFVALQDIAKVYSLRAKYQKVDIENLSSNARKNLKRINKIDKACSVLSDPYKTIILNTFFEKKDLYWWVDYYSKTTYYRLRKKAIKTFLLAYELQ